MAVQINIFIEVSESMLISLIILLHIFSRFDSLDISNFIFLFFSVQVAYANKDLHAQVIVDLATLTGAQGAATGKFIRQSHNCHNFEIYFVDYFRFYLIVDPSRKT